MLSKWDAITGNEIFKEWAVSLFIPEEFVLTLDNALSREFKSTVENIKIGKSWFNLIDKTLIRSLWVSGWFLELTSEKFLFMALLEKKFIRGR